MTQWQLHTPVALIIFNRPDTTARVFEEVARARPPLLFIIADGPRVDRSGEAEQCAATRAITEHVDWPCEVHRLYADTNMGCGARVSSGITWVFEQVETAIILEDDCLPEPTFFRFCEELLERYRDDERVMCISGDNFQFGRHKTLYSYYFSRYPHIWGWATWGRAWQHFDWEMREWPTVRNSGWVEKVLGEARIASYWRVNLERVYGPDKSHTWSYQWHFACWLHNGLTVLPAVNLVSNIGFGAAGTHTTGNSPFANMGTRPLAFPLRHPPVVIRDAKADARSDKTVFLPRPLLLRAVGKLRRMLRTAAKAAG